MLEHGFYNMDCMQGMREFPDNFFDLAIVDPPYGINVTGRHAGEGKCSLGSSGRKYHAFDDTAAPGADYFDELRRVSKDQIIWGGNYFLEHLGNTGCMIFWDKGRRNMDFADGELAWTSIKDAVRCFGFLWNGAGQGDPHNPEQRIHPTQKPVALYKWLLNRYAKPGFKILDTHVGSASSLIACELMGYEYWGFEIDPVFYEDALHRLESARAQTSFLDKLTE